MKETTVIFNYCWSLCYQRNKETHGVVTSMSLQRVLKGAVSDPNCTRGMKRNSEHKVCSIEPILKET